MKTLYLWQVTFWTYKPDSRTRERDGIRSLYVLTERQSLADAALQLRAVTTQDPKWAPLVRGCQPSDINSINFQEAVLHEPGELLEG